jgi:hypothetical protein
MQTRFNKLSIILVLASTVSVFAADPAVGSGAADSLAIAKAFDKDGNGQLSSAESQALREYFTSTAAIRSLDTNKNGILEDAEIKALKDAFAAAMSIRAFDTNKNGQFDDGEINALNTALNKQKSAGSIAGSPTGAAAGAEIPIGSALSAPPKPGPAHPMKTARSFDLDDTNQIEGAEVAAIRSAFATNPDLKPFDLNKNGTLEDPEIAALNIKLGKPKPVKPAPKIKVPVVENKPELNPENKAKDTKDGSSIGELALAEVREFDVNHDGKITGLEEMSLRKAFVSNPKSWLYIYDENGNKVLDTDEIAKINSILTPGDPAAVAKTQAPKGKAGVKDGQIKL